MIQVKPVEFTEWHPWDQRRNLITEPPQLGVYVWGHFHKAPLSAPLYLDLPAELIYVGETKNLNQRPLTGPHHRLAHYKATYPDDPRFEHLYVAVFRVEESKQPNEHSRLLRTFTRYLEDDIYWKYVQTHGRRAALNYAAKAGAPLRVEPCCCSKPTAAAHK